LGRAIHELGLQTSWDHRIGLPLSPYQTKRVLASWRDYLWDNGCVLVFQGSYSNPNQEKTLDMFIVHYICDYLLDDGYWVAVLILEDLAVLQEKDQLGWSIGLAVRL
jgi:hypothetical protein